MGHAVIERLPERVRTPAVARAATSPSAVLLAGAGMSAAILGGLPVAAAALVGGAAWALRVALAVPRGTKGERINPSALRQPWRNFVRDALRARAQFADTARQARAGPLRDRLGELGSRLDTVLQECWRIARHGHMLDSALRHLDVDAIERELDDIRAERRAAGGEARRALERAEEAVQAQLASAQRIGRISADARNRLRLLNAQLDEAVARALELSLHTGDSADLRPLSADVETLVGELESLRQALEETTAAGMATTGLDAGEAGGRLRRTRG